MNSFLQIFIFIPIIGFILSLLIPKDKEDEFYEKIREVASKNAENGEDAPLTQKQMIEICVVLNGKTVKEDKKIEEKLESYMLDTKFGIIYLN
jgi:hypothetical protein